MKMTDTFRSVLAICLVAGVAYPMQTSSSSAEESPIVGTWRTMIGSPSTFSNPSSSVVFTTAFESNGTYRTVAVVEGGNGEWGAGGTYVMSGHYQLQAPSVLTYRLENSELCVAGNFCSPTVPPGERLGVVQTINLQFEGNGSIVADGQRWTRIQ